MFFRQMLRTQPKQALSAARRFSTEAPASKSLVDRVKAVGVSAGKAAERALGSYAEPLVYNAKVAGALAKQVYITEKLAPPTSFSTIVSAYQKIFQSVTSPTWWSHTVPAGDWKKLVVYGAEAVGLFSIGEIVRTYG
ncbi:hypothetical protein MCUN1_000204 [Malassezia cuniculi]|uniref:Uncharacterized protein n=1 Tax=Malassezia cuniculi TaxID=948313 RepID=A0AAF0J9K1_9BASI|nr:hypothetical protein MCUN1_000204 [Malassezia cuniculi]